MVNYLYGARVNGIQSHIFQTGKLKEIIGASEQVEAICHDKFEESLGRSFKQDQCILAAAGKVLYIFTDREECERHVYHFPKTISEFAPGVHFSQALIEFEGDLEREHIDVIEERLEIQSHKQNALGLFSNMFAKRSPRTGGPVTKVISTKDGEEYWDEVQEAKNQESSPKENANASERLFRKILKGDFEKYESHFSTDIQELLENRELGWIAVLHADGNSLGKKIQGCLKKLPTGKVQGFLQEFSSLLEEATTRASNIAFFQEIEPVFSKELKENPYNSIPFRPVILGGDDLTMILRGNLAFDYAQAYLRAFEIQTRIQLGGLASHFGLEKELGEGLSACAGIAYIKFNYPFHYGVDLSESLCKYAKGVSKKLNPDSPSSSLAFYKVQSSFTEDFNHIIEKELTAGTKSNPIRFNYGPYFLDPHPGYSTTKNLKRWSEKLAQPESPNTNLREWLSMLSINDENATNLMRRIRTLYPSSKKGLKLENPFPRTEKVLIGGKEIPVRYTHVFDAMSLSSI
ncbi:MAG: hypothetical protein AAF696_07915 [Bacteroidota bacterium]